METIRLRKPRILIVDDEPVFTRLLKTNLEDQAGYEVAMTNKAREAHKLAKEFKPDFVLMDVMMPDGSGGDAARLIENDPALKGTRVTFVTAAVKKGELGSGVGVIGGKTFFAKPVRLADLITHIEKNLPKT